MAVHFRGLGLVVLVALASCGGGDDESNSVADGGTAASDAGPVRCVVQLHGKGGSGGDTVVGDDLIRTVRPTGNEDGWGGRQWIYFPDDRYVQARDVVGEAIDANDCDVAVVNGFSNGASFAASMFCQDERFEDVVQGYVIDDPVTDVATDECSAADDLDVALYWTTAIDQPAGTDCAAIDWTCAGGTTVDVQTYAERMGTTVQASPLTEHLPYLDAPEITAFLDAE